MIALITSTIVPGQGSILGGGQRSLFGHRERYDQTLKTIFSLKAHGINEMFLVDNSDDGLPRAYADGLAGMGVNLLPIRQYQFENRSINEVLMALFALRYLSDGEPVLKISGRYSLNDRFVPPDGFPEDFIVRPYGFKKKNGMISTRCYIARDKRLLEATLKQTLSELYLYNARIVGPRSFIKFLKQALIPSSFSETTISIEMALCRVLKYNRNKLRFLDSIGLEGAMAGAAGQIDE